MQFYNFTFYQLPVTVHLLKDRRFLWQRVVGIQIGDWFFGAIKGYGCAGDVMPKSYVDCDDSTVQNSSEEK